MTVLKSSDEKTWSIWSHLGHEAVTLDALNESERQNCSQFNSLDMQISCKINFALDYTITFDYKIHSGVCFADQQVAPALVT